MEIEDNDYVIVVVADRNVEECYRLPAANGEFDNNKEIKAEKDLDIEEILSSVLFHGESINIDNEDANNFEKELLDEHKIKDEENDTSIKEEYSGDEHEIINMFDCGSSEEFGVNEHDIDYCEEDKDKYVSLKKLSQVEEIKPKYKKPGKKKMSMKESKQEHSSVAKDSNFDIDPLYLNNVEILCDIKHENISDDEQEAQDELFDYYKQNRENKQLSANLSKTKEEKHRYTMLKPWQTKSLVKQLRVENPEAAKDSKLLINLIVEEMRRLRPPSPPKGYLLNNDDVMLVCSVCGVQSERILAARRHFQEKHGPRYLHCFACGVNFRSNTNLYKHEKKCIAADATLVLKARAIFVGSKGRSRPFISKNKYKMFKDGKNPCKVFSCELCPAKFRYKLSLDYHLNSHKGVKPYLCPYCPLAYTSASALYRHRKKHNNQRYTCDHCNGNFKSKETLIAHLYTHLPEKRFGCDTCGRRFAQKRALLQHQDTQHELRAPPHACTVCDKRYFRLSLLKDHMKKVHGLNVISRKMYFKSLPHLTTTELEQATIVMKSEEYRQI